MFVARETGLRSAVGTPIIVEGRLWGLIAVGSCEEQPLPPDTEGRLASFTELAVTAIANTESRAELARLAEEQAALRRVATLVARGTPQEELFAAVVDEVGELLPIESASMCRYDSDGSPTFVATWGKGVEPFPVGSRLRIGGKNLGTIVFETSRPARLDLYVDTASAPLGAGVTKAGIRSSVATPITVEGRLWGVIAAGSVLERPLPPDTEARLGSFTELVATAIANAESRAELAASRARIVAAADASRRRIERDLHDGAQQRLVHAVIVLKLALRVSSLGAHMLDAQVSGSIPQAESGTSAILGSPMLKARVPPLIDLPEQAWLDVAMMQKDIRLARSAAAELAIPLPSAAAAAADEMLTRACDLGYAHRDLAALHEVLAKSPAA